MPNSSLLVPGTGGTSLLDSNGNDLGYPLAMRIGVATGGLVGKSADELVALLSMAHVPGQIAPTKTSLIPGLSLRPGHVIEAAYNQIPAIVNRFLYDWRADLRYSAQQLLDFLRERKPVGGRWNVIGHSQGGLLILLASKLLPDPNAFSTFVRSVVLVASPVAGTLNAANALISGDEMGPAANADFRKILRTWPALYQMMPSWPAVLLPDESVAPKQLFDLGAWSGLDGVTQDMLDRAIATRKLFDRPFVNLGGDVNLTIVMTRTRATGNALEQSDGVLTAQSLTFELGDTLVPYETTVRWLGSDAQFVKKVTGPVREHSFLCDDPAIADIVSQAIA
jgi:pimeloyl-ACP methyl ester carboxylesterase